MRSILIKGEKHEILWDYGVIIDTADELGLEYVDEVFEIFKEYLPDESGNAKRVKVKNLKDISVLARNMILAAGGSISQREVLNAIVDDPMNIERMLVEVQAKLPKDSEDSASKKKLSD